jgi:hypothetical protein
MIEHDVEIDLGFYLEELILGLARTRRRGISRDA